MPKNTMVHGNHGYFARLKNLIGMSLPDHAALQLRIVNRPYFVDYALRGTLRFAMGLGSDLTVWTTSAWFNLIKSVPEQNTELYVDSIPAWLKVGDLITVGKREPKAVAAIDTVLNKITLAKKIGANITAPEPVYVYAVSVDQTVSMVNSTTVVLDSSYPILPNDTLLSPTEHSGLAEHTVTTVVDLNDTDDRKQITLSSQVGAGTGPGKTWYLVAHPAYISDNIPLLSTVSNQGPALVDFNSQPLVNTSWAENEYLDITFKDTALEIVNTATERNEIIENFPIPGSALLFGHLIHGRLNYTGADATRLIAETTESGDVFCGIVLDLLGAWESGSKWTAPCKPSADGKIRWRFKGGAWQEVSVIAGGANNVTIQIDVDTPASVEVVFCATTTDDYCDIGQWQPERRAAFVQYSHLAKITGPRWLTTGLILKPAFGNIGLLGSEDENRLDSGRILL